MRAGIFKRDLPPAQSSKMQSITLFVAAVLLSASFALSGNAFERQIHCNSEEEVELASLTKPVRDRIASLRSGMTRAQVEKHFEQNGGLSTAEHQQYFVSRTIIGEKVVMVELSFQPAGIPDAVYADAKLATKWWSTHKWEGNTDRDILRGISKPFLSRVAY